MSNARGLNLPLLRRITNALSGRLFPKQSRNITTYFVGAKKMASVNERFLGHEGPTDVITFDYGDYGGEIFICLEVALAQAKEFGMTPQMELVRYLVHGLLHLKGYDDCRARDRARMKKAEDKWVRWVAAEFPCDKVWSRKRAG
jgi:probable rRNA maturation factor